MIRVYTFAVNPPEGVDPIAAGQLMTKQLDRMAAQSPELIKSEVAAEVNPNQIFLKIWFEGRDHWYIQKRIKFPLIAALRKGGCGMKHVRSTQVEVPVNGRDKPTPRVPPPSQWAPTNW